MKYIFLLFLIACGIGPVNGACLQTQCEVKCAPLPADIVTSTNILECNCYLPSGDYMTLESSEILRTCQGN